ncbi:transmembrane emp24 domain-containing protein 11 isoform X2 [Camelus ferus]|uniref:Transmembrane emp24 domain-containing protein 11 isoform X2 n=1 Tax=Camelus ferus TaxID=419612 RepID=A0A8B8U0I0_CAMFR|nr:transmembrane emp24 domain-containing protein 11 isoform X2 [Camelus ferus]
MSLYLVPWGWLWSPKCGRHMSLLTEINVQGYPRKPDTRSRVTCNGSAADKAPPGVAAATEMPVLTFLLSFCFLLSTEAFYFHMGEREEKCIIEDIPGDTLVTGTFKTQQWDTDRHDFLQSAPGLGMFVAVTTYNDERIHLDIRVGEHDLDAAIAQAKDKVNEVSFKLEHLIEQIEQIIKEQNYQRDREEKFRITSEDTNNNVLWWAFAQTLIFISVGIFQMKYLKDFFIAKKLV